MNELVARLRKGWDVCSQIDLEEAADALERQQKKIEELERERDALAAAMPSEGADAAIGYACMKERAERAEDTLRNINSERLQAEARVAELELELIKERASHEADNGLANRWLKCLHEAESALRECMAHADAMARLLATSAHYHDCYTLQEYRAWRAKQ